MATDTALLLSFFLVAASIVLVLMVLSYRRRKAVEEEMRQAASARGWQFESVTEGGFFVRRWRGTTDNVVWTAESLRSVRRAKKGRHRRRRAARWRTAIGLRMTTPVVCIGVPAGKETPEFSVAQGEGWLAQLAQKAAGMALDMAIDMYFGKERGREVDAGKLRLVPGVSIPGFIVMAEDTNEAGRMLEQGLKNALVEATNDRSSVFSEADRPWILISKSGMAIGRLEPFVTTADVEGFVGAGIQLTRTATFGRPSPS